MISPGSNFRLVILVAGILFSAGALAAQSVQLSDGSILVGEIKNADGEGFILRRSDNGGVLKMQWSHLSESSAKLHRAALDLLNTDEAEVTVTADVLSYESSTGKITEIVGRIVKEDSSNLYIRRGRDVIPIRRSALRGKSERKVIPSEIYTTEEYYQILLSESAPGEDADKHLELGETLMRVRDYAHAGVHMRKAKELGGGRQASILDKRLEHLALLKGAAAEQELLDDIRTQTNRQKFVKAAEKLSEFKAKFPNSKLQGELARLENKFTRARATHLTKDIARRWYSYVDKLANEKAADPKFTLAMAKQFAEREMGKEIRTQIAKAHSTTPAEVEELWAKRFDVTGAVSSKHYYYSIGSWLLGDKAVLKGTKQGESEAAASGQEVSEKDKKMQQDLKRFQDAMRALQKARQRAGAGGKGAEKKEVTPEDWWKDARPNQRKTWLKAYYGEFSGDMVLTSAHVNPCTSCGGTGKQAVQGAIGQTQQLDCPICHRTRYQRDIRVK